MKTLVVFSGLIFVFIILVLGLASMVGRGDLLNAGISNMGSYPKVEAPPTLVPLIPPREGETPLTVDELAELPLTEHAKNGHPERKLNAEKIRTLMITLTCRPVNVYICSHAWIVTCPFWGNDKLYCGLVIGLDDIGLPPIVTGYPGDWARKTQGCQGPYTIVQ